MKRILISFLFTVWAVAAQAQGEMKLTYFPLPVMNETDAVRSEAYVSTDFREMGAIALKSYAGNDPEVAMLAKMISDFYEENKSAYMKMSDKRDTTLENSYGFYQMFVSHSPAPVLHYQVKAGDYSIFFVHLQRGFPLMTFALRNKGGELVNNPAVLQHPAIAAMADAVNKSFLDPARFKAVTQIAGKSLNVSFDSSFGGGGHQLRFYFDYRSVSYDVNKPDDSTTVYGAQDKGVLEFYAQTLKVLKAGQHEVYLSQLSADSRRRIQESFKLSGINERSMSDFRKYKTSASKVTGILDLGAVDLLFAEQPSSSRRRRQTVYIIEYKGQYQWINENFEFYLDDLMRTTEFRKALGQVEQK